MRTKQKIDVLVGGVLETYAARGVFKGFANTAEGSWRMLWHRDRYFDLRLEGETLTFAEVLPSVPARSPMMREYKAFIAAFASPDLPEHKRVDPAKAELRVLAKGGAAGLVVRIVDGDWEYGVRKLIHAVHETYLVFLYDGAYYDYLIETFNLDPDHMA